MTLIGRWSAFDRFHRRIEIRVEREISRHLGLQAREFYALSALSALSEEASGCARLLYVGDLAQDIGAESVRHQPTGGPLA